MSYDAPPPPPPPPPPPGGPVGPGGYGQPGGYPMPQKTSPLAIVALVTGILGVFPCCSIFVFSIAAGITGYIGRKQIAESNGALKGDGMAKAGFILGIVGAVLGLLYWILVITTGGFDYGFSTAP